MPRKYNRKRKRTNVKRRPRKRRYRKRAYRGRRILNASRPLGLAPTRLVRFKFRQTVGLQIDPARLGDHDYIQAYTFRANSPWDPDYSHTTGSTSVENWSDYRYRYGQYFCLSSKIKITPYLYEQETGNFSNPDHPMPALIAINLDNDTTPTLTQNSNATGIMRQPRTTYKFMNLAQLSANNPRVALRKTFSYKREMAIKDYKDNHELWNATNGNAPHPWYYHICAIGMEPQVEKSVGTLNAGDAAVYTPTLKYPPIGFMVDIEYVVAFRDPQEVDTGTAFA